MKVVLASNNPGKIAEFRALLAPFHLEIISQAELSIPDIEETGLTFVENALLKARHAARLSKLPAIADDSGLVVPALKGAPGIYSARYAGKKATADDNIEKLLAEMASLSDEKRQASYHCTLVFMLNETDPVPVICEGTWSGSILKARQGSGGFGYDPVFYVAAENKSAAELPLPLKNKMSHRGNALQLLIQQLPEKLCMPLSLKI